MANCGSKNHPATSKNIARAASWPTWCEHKKSTSALTASMSFDSGAAYGAAPGDGRHHKRSDQLTSSSKTQVKATHEAQAHPNFIQGKPKKTPGPIEVNNHT